MDRDAFKDYARDGCPNGHKPDPARPTHCGKCGKYLVYADGLHVHDPRSDRMTLALDTGRAPEDKGRNGSPAGAGAEGASLPGETEGLAIPSGAPSPRSN